jgi:hypothetical protein
MGPMIQLVALSLLAKSAQISINLMTLGWITGVFGLLQLVPITVSGIGIRELSYAFFFNAYHIDVSQTIVFCFTLYLGNLLRAIIGLGVYLVENGKPSLKYGKKLNPDPKSFKEKEPA